MLQNVTGETEERPNRTKTAPKQTEKRGQRAGGKRDTRKGSQKVSVFPVGPGGLEAVAAMRDACKSGCPVLSGWGGLHAAGRGIG